MSSRREVFIETTTIVDYTLKGEHKANIEAILSQYTSKVSSNYVKMELKKGVISYLVYLHNKIINCTKWSDVFKAIHGLSAGYQKNRLGTILEVLQNFWIDIEQTKTKDLAEDVLSNFLRKQCASYLRLSILRLWRQLGKITNDDLNPMSCFIDIPPPKEVGELLDNTPQKCNKSIHECNIKDFFTKNMQAFQDILTVLLRIPQDKLDEETKRRIKSLKEIIRLLPYHGRAFSNKQQNVKECWNCGDAILAVIPSQETHILHRNPRHYPLLCNALNKQCITY